MYKLIACLLFFITPLSALAWGEKGHLMVNRLAIDTARSSLPEFMNASRNILIYNGYEPDRWREEANTPMNIAQAPDHFFDSELWGAIATIEPDRYAFMSKLPGRKVEAIGIGYLPYAIIENYGKLRNAFRHWRSARTAQDREAARAAAIHYAGVMGHYVGDGSQPLHMSIHYNGWADNSPNPNNFTKDRRLHGRYEGAYVDVTIQESVVRSKTRSPRRLPDVFGEIKKYLQLSFNDLDTLYALEKAGEFNPERPMPKGTDFIATQLARAATMLSDIWYTAWLQSAEPLPTPE